MKFQPKMARLTCLNCDKYYNLPKNGKIQQNGDKKCPYDNF